MLIDVISSRGCCNLYEWPPFVRLCLFAVAELHAHVVMPSCSKPCDLQPNISNPVSWNMHNRDKWYPDRVMSIRAQPTNVHSLATDTHSCAFSMVSNDYDSAAMSQISQSQRQWRNNIEWWLCSSCQTFCQWCSVCITASLVTSTKLQFDVTAQDTTSVAQKSCSCRSLTGHIVYFALNCVIYKTQHRWSHDQDQPWQVLVDSSSTYMHKLISRYVDDISLRVFYYIITC